MKKEIFDFSEALRRMKEGKKVRRCGWGSSDSYSIGKDRWGREYVYITEKPHVSNSLYIVWQYSRNRLGGGVRMNEKVLTLTVSKQWFDMIVAGEKTEEYRTIKGYWTVRLYDVFAKNPTKYLMDKKISGDIDYLKLMIRCNHFIAKQYTHVLFINGYRKDSPRIEKEIESITIGKPKKGLCPDKWLDTEFFIIKFK